MQITRYPHTQNKSLRAWTSADEYVLKKIEEQNSSPDSIAISNDRFGFLSCHLHHLGPWSVIERKSQQKSIEKNLIKNSLEVVPDKFIPPHYSLPEKIAVGIIVIPKSMELFRLYLHKVHCGLKDDGMVICSFMTRHFSPQILSIAKEYFEEAEQSLTRKKARLLTLREKKKVTGKVEFLNTISFRFKHGAEEEIRQYSGVFSSGKIDYATQFLLERLELGDKDKVVMDLASGNGVIARAIQLQSPEAELHLTDDSLLAIESSKLNLDSRNTYFHWNDTLQEFSKNHFDLIVTNPPFHFEHENNIEVSVRLFQEAAHLLKIGGKFICVANRHLNYKTHLDKIFRQVNIIAENNKFLLYESIK